MSEYLEVGVEGRLGVIALNRPQAINALTVDMVRAISAQLEAWRNDPNVRVVLFEGRGPKGFCAGGDVRWVREQVLAGRAEDGFRFFADEYRMNALISGYEKPVAALADGIVMGGGIGIAGHADFRFTTTNARYAMPEAAIGFICDIGVNAILAMAPEHRALLFLLTGMPVGAADALALGLADCVIPADRMGEVRSGIAAAADSASPDVALVALMQAEGIEAGDPVFCAVADRLDDEMAAASAAEIVEAVANAAEADSQLISIADTLGSRSPASLEAILQNHRAARTLGDLRPILDLDLRLARLMASRADFAEGVRAVLVDKDNAPRWTGDVPNGQIHAEIDAVLASWTAGRQSQLST
jgi:enoyl-CoA hydratase